MRPQDLIQYWIQQNADKEQIDHITGKDVKTWK